MTPTNTQGDALHSMSRSAWLGRRAANALQRPVFIGAISVATFVTAIVSLVAAPRTERNPRELVPTLPRPETLSVAAAIALGRVNLVQADSTVAATRALIVKAVPDSTISAPVAVTPDSLTLARAKGLEAMIARIDQAPLAASYHALAESAEMQGDARIKALADSLTQIEREREGFDAAGGVDPIFVALTSRANEIGRSMKAVAVTRLQQLRAPAVPVTPQIAQAPAIDTAGPIATRDSIKSFLDSSATHLAQLRAASVRMDAQEREAREQAMAVAPPLALLASAFVLSAVVGFAAALVGELRRPRVYDAQELERDLGIRVLSTIENEMPSVERGRREADKAAPQYFDPNAEAYQLAYLGLANDHPAVLFATIVGDDAAVAAVVGCNLAAVAAAEARKALVIDVDASCSVSRVLHVRCAPGVTDIIDGRSAWPDATVAAQVGRDKSIDIVPCGSGTPSVAALPDMLKADAWRLARYYDAVIVVATIDEVEAGLTRALPSNEIVYCVRRRHTDLDAIRAIVSRLRDSGATLRGIVIWGADPPRLPKSVDGGPSKRARPRETTGATA